VDASGRSAQRSFTVHGGEQLAANRQAELVETYGVRRTLPGWQAERVTLGALLVQFVEAPHVWSPTTWVSHESVVRALRRDRLSGCRVDRLTPSVMQRAIMQWGAAGASVAVISGRFLVLHSAITWAMAERMLRSDPLVGMKSPPRPYPRKHLRPDLVRELMATAEQRREKADAALVERPGSRAAELRLFRAEQDVLLVNLTADTGARRGELAALRVDDLDGRVLTIERARKGSIVGSTKTYRRGRITVGKTVAALWAEHVAAWRSHPLAGAVPGPWLFTPRPDRQAPISPSGLTQRFDKIADAAGLPEACLHRLRHSVGTFLVGDGKILKAAGRLRHRDPSTTLRNYADALPPDDQDVADALDHLYHPPD
jgi:integrase